MVVAAAILLVSCAAPVVKIQHDLSGTGYTVAVLPMYNATNDIDGPKRIREEFDRRLTKWHYQIKSLKDVDQILRDRMGITLGSQLEMTTPQKLGEVLGVDGVIYGYLLNFDDITTGVYNVKKVRAGFKLVESSTGNILWSNGQGVKSVLIGSGDIGKGIAIIRDAKSVREGAELLKAIKGIENIPGLDTWHLISLRHEESLENATIIALGEKLLSKAFGVHLKVESNRMLDMIMRDLVQTPEKRR